MVIIEVVVEDVRRTFVDGYIYSLADLELAFRMTRIVRRNMERGDDNPAYDRLRPNWMVLLDLFLQQDAPDMFDERANEVRMQRGLPIRQCLSATYGLTEEGRARGLEAFSLEFESDPNNHLYHSFMIYGGPPYQSYLWKTLGKLSFRVKLAHEYQNFGTFSDTMNKYLQLDNISLAPPFFATPRLPYSDVTPRIGRRS